MSKVDELRNYDICIRFNDDGELCGAHQQRRRWLVIDGETILAGVLQPAEPVDLAALGELIDGIGAQAIEQVAVLAPRVEQLQSQNEDLAAQLVAVQALVRDLQAAQALTPSTDIELLEA